MSSDGRWAPGEDQLYRRWVRLPDDYEALLAWERESWPINFPDEVFSERAFRQSLDVGVRFQRMYVYERAGEMLGWLWLDLHRSGVAAHIRHVQVASDHWGEGLGTTLVRDAIALSAAAACAALTLNVTKSNTRALRLYESLGFELDQDNGARQRMIIRLDEVAAGL